MSGLVDHTGVPAAAEDPAAPVSAPRDPVASAAGPDSDPGPRPSLRERSRIRRRVRYLRRLRELQLRDLGGFLLEQVRLGRENPRVVEAKLSGATETDRELRTLEGVLEERRPLREVREPGVGGACPSCGSVHGSGDRYCSWCGRRL